MAIGMNIESAQRRAMGATETKLTSWDVDFLYAKSATAPRALIILNQPTPRALLEQLWRASERAIRSATI